MGNIQVQVPKQPSTRTVPFFAATISFFFFFFFTYIILFVIESPNFLLTIILILIFLTSILDGSFYMLPYEVFNVWGTR